MISELNSQACTPPVNASPPPYGKPTHDSGPRLVANHYHAGDFHALLFAGFYRRFRHDPYVFFKIVLTFYRNGYQLFKKGCGCDTDAENILSCGGCDKPIHGNSLVLAPEPAYRIIICSICRLVISRFVIY